MTYREFCAAYCPDGWDAETKREEFKAYTKAQTPEPKPLPPGDIVTGQELSEALHAAGALMAKELAKRDAKIAALESGQLKLGGVYRSGVVYECNTLVSHQGGLWLCRARTDSKPGAGNQEWRLAVKSGDAK